METSLLAVRHWGNTGALEYTEASTGGIHSLMRKLRVVSRIPSCIFGEWLAFWYLESALLLNRCVLAWYVYIHGWGYELCSRSGFHPSVYYSPPQPCATHAADGVVPVRLGTPGPEAQRRRRQVGDGWWVRLRERRARERGERGARICAASESADE